MKEILENRLKISNYGIIFLLLFFSNCSNKYEKDLVGEYKLSSFERTDTLNIENIDSSILKLSPDKTFSLILLNNKITGVWEAGDNGDFTWIKFALVNKKILTEGRAGDSTILINTPTNFFYPKLRKLIFHR